MKDKSSHSCVNYIALNKVTIKRLHGKSFFPCWIKYILEKLYFFTKVNLKSGYHWDRTFKADIPPYRMQPLWIHGGSFFGLNNALDSFSWKQCPVLLPFASVRVSSLSWKIFLFSQLEYGQHLLDVEKVLKLIEEHQLYINEKKITFNITKVSLARVSNWIPKRSKQSHSGKSHKLRSFVGLVNKQVSWWSLHHSPIFLKWWLHIRQ